MTSATSPDGGQGLPGRRPTDVTEAAAWLGERFAASFGAVSGPGWQPAETLFGAGLEDALADVQAARGAPSRAIAGSLLVSAYANRLTGPVLAALHHDRRQVDAGLPEVRVRMVDGALREIAFERAPRPAGPAAVPQTARRLFTGNLAVVVDRVHAATRAGSRVLWSNVAIAIGTSLLALSWASSDRARYLADARAFLRQEPRAAALITVRTADVDGEPWFFNERLGCCLAFRTAVNLARPDPYCGNCCILDQHERLARFRTAARRWRDRSAGSAAAVLPRPSRITAHTATDRHERGRMRQ